jgi:hypothetical protein
MLGKLCTDRQFIWCGSGWDRLSGSGVFARLCVGLKWSTRDFRRSRREDDQAFAMEVEVDERDAGAQSVVVFGQTPVAYFVEAEGAFQDVERMFDLGPCARCTPVLALL